MSVILLFLVGYRTDTHLKQPDKPRYDRALNRTLSFLK